MTHAGRLVTRRSFLHTAAAVSSLAAVPAGAWARVPRSAGRLNIGVIGTGGMGTWHLGSFMKRAEADNLRVTRVCDVYRRRLTNAARVIHGESGCETMEYREVLDDRSVDAVLIATPDHWHTKIAIEAMEAGKDVYVEKPLSLTIEQALACRDAVKRTGRTLQVGPQYTSNDSTWKARDLIERGRIGKVVWSQAAYCRNSRGGQFNWAIDADASPGQDHGAEGYVWWDRWLGHEWGLAPRIPWNADHFFRFRKYFAYNGGVATDLLYHKLSPLLLSISGPGGEYPKRVVASGGRFLEKDERDIPDTFLMMVDYPSEHTVVLASVMTNDTGLDTVIRGQHATLRFEDGSDTGNRGRISVREQEAWAADFRKTNADLVGTRVDKEDTPTDGLPTQAPNPAHGQAGFDVPIAERRDHVGNWLDAIRDGAALDCNVDLGASTMVAIKMGVEAYRQNRVMTWDAQAERAAAV